MHTACLVKALWLLLTGKDCREREVPQTPKAQACPASPGGAPPPLPCPPPPERGPFRRVPPDSVSLLGFLRARAAILVATATVGSGLREPPAVPGRWRHCGASKAPVSGRQMQDDAHGRPPAALAGGLGLRGKWGHLLCLLFLSL